MKADLELLRNRTRLASSAAVLEEKDRAIDSAIDTIDSLGRENKISPGEASLAVGVLKIHKSSRDELEAFQQVHDELDPSFTRRLKESFPDLSESNIRVAAYVAIGMSNKQIARVMMIEYKSVLTARHRLRTKMGLAKTDSLEQALRRFSRL
ncbi:MAG: LuxR C-terminal-related transcriptional regulator [Muribaculaceae bacterium]|nr:LuxR C-terminal-related transcriptional regulator [Muribaculaceae bacterium]